MRSAALLLLVLAFAAPAVAANSMTDYLLMGSDAQYRGDLDKAASAFGSALAMEPDNEYALNQLGLISAKQEKFGKAEKLFRKVVSLSPDNTFARVMLGLMLLRDNKIDKAVAQFNKTLEIDPHNANAYYFLGTVYAVEHNKAKAVAYLRKAQSAGSDDPETHFRLARAFQGLDMVNNARLEYDLVLALNPRHTKAMNAMGWLFYNQGERKLAVDAWTQALKINPKDREASLSLSKIYNDEALAAYRAEDKAKAKVLWKKTLAYEPGNKAAKYYLKKLR